MLWRSSAWMLFHVLLGHGRCYEGPVHRQTSQTSVSQEVARGIVNLPGVHSGVDHHRDKKHFLNTDHIQWSYLFITHYLSNGDTNIRECLSEQGQRVTLATGQIWNRNLTGECGGVQSQDKSHQEVTDQFLGRQSL